MSSKHRIIYNDEIQERWNIISDNIRSINEIITTVSELTNTGKKMYIDALNMRYTSGQVVTAIKFGAVLITRSGETFEGVNKEEWGLILARHAEMTAIDKMRNKYEDSNNPDDITIDTIVVVGDPKSINKEHPVYPCPLCLNYISQFSTGDTMVIAGDLDENIRITTMNELCPEPAF